MTNQPQTQATHTGAHAPTLRRGEFAVRAFIAAGALALTAALVFLLWWSRHVFLLLFAGVTFGVFLHGLSEWLSRRTKLPYYWSLALVVLLLLVVLGLIGWLLGARISEQFSQLARTLPQSLEKIQGHLQGSEWGRWLISRDSGGSGGSGGEGFPGGQNLVSRVTDLLGSVVSGLAGAVIIAFIGLYAAVEPRTYRDGLIRLVPKPHRDRAGEVLGAVDESLRRWLVARILSMAIVGVLTTLGLMLLGVPLPLALGLLAFFLEVIPNLGPVLSAIPAVLVAWTSGGTAQAVQVAVLFIVIQAVESYILLPLLQRETVRLYPILSIVGVVLFGMIGGILGALVAAPLLVVLMVLVKMLYVEDALGDRSVHVVGEPNG